MSSTGAATVKAYWPNALGLETEASSGTQLYWTHLDRQGSVIAITKQNGAIKERIRAAHGPLRYDIPAFTQPPPMLSPPSSSVPARRVGQRRTSIPRLVCGNFHSDFTNADGLSRWRIVSVDAHA